MPAKGDPDEYRENGSFYQSMKKRFPTSETLDFPTQEHGFIPRSDISIPENKDAVDQSLEKILSFYSAH
jgi:hypothetical protein